MNRPPLAWHSDLAFAAPEPGPDVGGAVVVSQLAWMYNDPQVGVENGAEGRPQDRNVELLLADPRKK